MRKTVRPLAAAVALAVMGGAQQAAAGPAAVAAGGDHAPAVTTAQEEGALTDADRTFVTEAARAASATIRMSELAADRAKSGRVQDFARRVAEERAATSAELAEIARDKGVAMPAGPTAEEEHVIEYLDELAGSAFDAEYMIQQAEALEETVILFRAHLAETGDEALRGFAEAHLPTLEERAATAREMAEQVEDTAN